MQKKTKRKLNKKRFFGLLIFLAIGAIFITYLLNLKVSNVLITGTSLVSDATIIRKTNLRDYPYYKDIKNMYDTTLNSILEKLNLELPKTNRNIFDELADKIAS